MKIIKLLAIVVLILGLLSNAVGILNTPRGDQGASTNNQGESKNFSITIDKNATVNWYINSSQIKGEVNKTSSFYLNTSAQVGFWNVSAVAYNESNPSEMDMTTWWWIVNSALPTETAPGFTAGPTATSLDTSANISFTINQSNANTIVRYGNDSSSLILESGWQNGTGNLHNIQLSGLSPGKQYFYSVYAYNASNLSLFSFSASTISFTTGNPTAPNITNVTNDGATGNSINFTIGVDQGDALIGVNYGLTSSLELGFINNTDSGTTRIRRLTSLIPGTTYYYSVFAYNKINQSYFNNTNISNFTTLTPTAPNITNVTNDGATATSINFTVGVDQTDALVSINYGLTSSLELGFINNTDSGTTRIRRLTSLIPGTTYYYSVFAYNKINQSFFNSTNISNITTVYPPPTIDSFDPTTTTMDMTVGDSKNLNVTIGNQAGTLSWYENNNTTPLTFKSVNSSDLVIYTFSRNTKGKYNITANLSNANGSDTQVWTLNVRPTTFFTGNRIWDGSKPEDFAPDYTWTPQSFSGFYYDAKDDVGSENIQIKSISRTISKNNIIYSTSPNEVYFTYNLFGKYQVIGFMADKYFAGYKNHTIPNPTNSFGDVSAIGQGQLHKVLMDDNTKRTIAVGGTLALRDGYVLQASDIDLNARTMFLRLLKDGAEVDSTPLARNETYVYKKRVGNVEDLPLILVRFEDVFSGNELQVAFLKGIFQISEDVTKVKTETQFGQMKVTEVNKDKIVMTNNNGDVGLNKGSIVDLMGDLKIIVADNDVLRFALSVDRPGDLEVRSTVFRETDASNISEWTPYNFGMNIGKTSIGFYYNLDDGLGNEKISMTQRNGRIIPDNKLVYSTTPEQVSFTYKPFGQYQVIGFMADKYFAGYKGHTIPHPTNSFGDISALSQGELHKIIIDDDTKRTIAVGGTIALKEGYVLKATDIDLNARTILLSLLKDGAEVDSTPLARDETYIYKKSIGSVSDLPIIMVRFENVFSGQELQVGFLKGIFQLSETATTVKIGSTYGKMEVTTVDANSITMSNNGDIGLDQNKNDVLMGNIKLKVADNPSLRFYFAVDVTADMIQNQLVIDAPAKAMAGDTIKIKITAGGTGLGNTTIDIGTDSGTTDKDGILNYTLPRTLKGTYSITASMTGYEKATQNIEIEKYVDYRLSIEAPSQANQYETITVKVLYNGTVMSGATVIFDNTTVGTSDTNGEVTYKLETSGTHSISASKTSYITVARDIEIRAPYSEFKGLDINITPNPGFAGEAFLVRSNITNVGTKSDSVQVDLIVNGTSVDNKTITLGAKEKVEVNFTRSETKAGNVTVEIMGQSMLYEAKEKPTNYLLIVGIVTVIGAIIIYILTSKGLLSLELLKEKFSLLTHKFNMVFKK